MDTKKGQMYIGRESETDEPVLLKASSLTTHGVVFGMTGSGKTETLKRLHASGETQTAALVKEACAAVNAEPLARTEYIEVVDADDLQALETVDREARIAAAVWIGEVRLIDNLPLR